ncbi:hypothetical protein TL16_g13124 [Triparma laevis f. inornata]|uniref:Uncharacterized protein n=1 Tax=Triparma laevis f. inornata TaxID=1714386 RepID=A0A9W7BRA5_9STRA|nr:hypothetical protein TL16_g13124 [Triparma laevis f. inornata]
MACLTYGRTAIFAYYAYSSDEQEQEKIRKFCVWIEVPITVTAMSISFTLKPRREDRLYKIFLYVQYFAYTFVSTFLGVVGNNFEARTTAEACVRSLFWLALLKLGMVFRSSIANLPVKELSNFLINDVVMGGMIIGLGQLALLTFASIQCDGEAGGDWRECNRTLVSQVGLSGMVALYTTIKFVSGVVPERILEKHMISMKKFASMRMNAEDIFQGFGLLIAGVCAVYLLGNYGTEGDFYNAAERYYTLIVPGVGAGCLLLTAVWKAVDIRGEMRRGEDFEQLRQGESSSSSSEVMLVEIIGLISQTANMVRHFRNDDMTWVGLNFAGTVILTVLFHFGLKLRATVGRLPDKDLENFLVDTLLKGGLKTLFSVLFIHFRTAKCVF